MRHHINFQETLLKKNYIGTLKHQIFEKIMNLFENRRTNGPNRRMTAGKVNSLAKEHVFQNSNLMKTRGEESANLNYLWTKVEKDFNYFSVQCKKFAETFIGSNKLIQFRTHMNTLGQIQILGIKHTEIYIKSEELGIQGKVDIVFDCLFQPDLNRFPEEVHRRDVIADLKTGQFTKKNNHQIMLYMMGYFPRDLADQLGMVIYSKSPSGEKGFTIDFVFPYKLYFLKLLIHKNKIAGVSSGTQPGRFQPRRPFIPDRLRDPHQISGGLHSIGRNNSLRFNARNVRVLRDAPDQTSNLCSMALKIMSMLFLAILIFRMELLKKLVPFLNEVAKEFSK